MDTKINRKVKCLETLIADIGAKSFPLYKIILFGSFTGNSFHERSDLDLCLVYEDREPTCKEKIEIENYVDDFVGHEMNVDFVYTSLTKLTTGCQVFKTSESLGW